MKNEAFRQALADSHIPGNLHDGILRWVEDGITPGSFLRALVLNDLRQAVHRADIFSEGRLPQIVRFLALYAPEGSFFSTSALTNWPLYVQASDRQTAEATEIEGGSK